MPGTLADASSCVELRAVPEVIDAGVCQVNSCGLLFRSRFVRTYRAIEQLVVLEIDLEEGRPLLNLSRNECRRQRIFNVGLKGAELIAVYAPSRKIFRLRPGPEGGEITIAWPALNSV